MDVRDIYSVYLAIRIKCIENIYIVILNIGPQMTLSLFGRNRWGNETIQGYARLHLPLGGGRRQIRAPIVNAKCANIWAALQSWLIDRNPELKDPRVLADGPRTKGLLLESFGEVVVSLQAITRGAEKLALDWGGQR